MKNILVLSGAGVGLFVGSLIGLLAALGRLDHEGTKGIPVVSMLFPAPEVDPDAEGEGEHTDGHGGTAGHDDPGDASHAAEGSGDQGIQSYKTGPDPFAEEDTGGGGHGGGHGGGDEAAAEHDDGAGGHEKSFRQVDPREQELDSETHHRRLQSSLYQTNYEPGSYFDFNFRRVDAQIKPDELNEYFAKAKDAIERSRNREKALDEREQQLDAQEQDIAQRHLKLVQLKQEVEQMELDLDRRIAEFRSEVDIIRNAERDNLKELAKSLQNLDTEAAADYVEAKWRAGRLGQSQVLKVLRTMKAAADDVLAALDADTRREILDRRLELGEEPEGAGR